VPLTVPISRPSASSRSAITPFGGSPGVRTRRTHSRPCGSTDRRSKGAAVRGNGAWPTLWFQNGRMVGPPGAGTSSRRYRSRTSAGRRRGARFTRAMRTSVPSLRYWRSSYAGPVPIQTVSSAAAATSLSPSGTQRGCGRMSPSGTYRNTSLAGNAPTVSTISPAAETCRKVAVSRQVESAGGFCRSDSRGATRYEPSPNRPTMDGRRSASICGASILRARRPSAVNTLSRPLNASHTATESGVGAPSRSMSSKSPGGSNCPPTRRTNRPCAS
jgi:hypothetical protein